MLQESGSSKDAALRAVGCTVANFQRLEHYLKFAAQLGPVQGTLQKIQRDASRRQERAETLTLGQAIQAWLTYCEGTQAPVAWTPDLFDLSIQMTFRLEGNATARDAHAEALNSLLLERNDLVHTRLVTFQWDSPEACNALVLELNAVNDRISEQMDFFTSLLSEIVKLHNEHTESVVAYFEKGLGESASGDSNT